MIGIDHTQHWAWRAATPAERHPGTLAHVMLTPRCEHTDGDLTVMPDEILDDMWAALITVVSGELEATHWGLIADIAPDRPCVIHVLVGDPTVATPPWSPIGMGVTGSERRRSDGPFEAEPCG